MNVQRARFYREVSVADASPSALEGEDAQRAGGGYRVLLDGKPLNTPAGAQLLLPTRALADAVADEWRAQGEKIHPGTMILTKLANTAIDCIARDRKAAIDQILAFACSDLVCYRGDAQTALAERQAQEWDPLLDWVSTVHGVKFKTGHGVAFIEQPADAMCTLESAIAARGDFVLAGLHSATALCGSAIIALALAEARLDADTAFKAAHVDEHYQWERWGKDQEAVAKADKKRSELFRIARVFELMRT